VCSCYNNLYKISFVPGKVTRDCLLPRGYKETSVTPRLFQHKNNTIFSALELDYLDAALLHHCHITLDQEVCKFCGTTLEWNYEKAHSQDILIKHSRDLWTPPLPGHMRGQRPTMAPVYITQIQKTPPYLWITKASLAQNNHWHLLLCESNRQHHAYGTTCFSSSPDTRHYTNNGYSYQTPQRCRYPSRRSCHILQKCHYLLHPL
jgi:hypothetical protein